MTKQSETLRLLSEIAKKLDALISVTASAHGVTHSNAVRDAVSSWGVKADQPLYPVFAVGHAKPIAWLKAGEPVNHEVMERRVSWGGYVLKSGEGSHPGNQTDDQRPTSSMAS